MTARNTKRLHDLAHTYRAIARELHALADDHERIEHARRDELDSLGYPQLSSGAGSSGHGGGELTGTEAAAQRVQQIGAASADVNDSIAAAIDAMRGGWIGATRLSINTLARILGVNVTTRPTEPPCHDGQLGKHAVEEWGDHGCIRPGVKAGMCQQHYMAWYRARQRDGVDTSRDHAPTAEPEQDL